MAHVQIKVQDPATRLTIATLLQADGHRLAEENPDVIITDDIAGAAALVVRAPTLVLASATQIRGAVAAMARGVFGYVFVPLQPGEVELMVRRALGASPVEPGRAVRTLEAVETEHILAVLRHCKNSRAKAARLLGVGRNTLWRKLKRIEAAPKES
jgi:DNA-binding NtrC family response regulator